MTGADRLQRRIEQLSRAQTAHAEAEVIRALLRGDCYVDVEWPQPDVQVEREGERFLVRLDRARGGSGPVIRYYLHGPIDAPGFAVCSARRAAAGAC